MKARGGIKVKVLRGVVGRVPATLIRVLTNPASRSSGAGIAFKNPLYQRTAKLGRFMRIKMKILVCSRESRHEDRLE